MSALPTPHLQHCMHLKARLWVVFCPGPPVCGCKSDFTLWLCRSSVVDVCGRILFAWVCNGTVGAAQLRTISGCRARDAGLRRIAVKLALALFPTTFASHPEDMNCVTISNVIILFPLSRSPFCLFTRLALLLHRRE